MANIKVMFINPNPRQMSLVQPVVALFSSIFKQHGVEMRFFDTTFFDMSEDFSNFDRKMQENLIVSPYEKELKRRGITFATYGNVYEAFRKEVRDYNPDVILASALESTAQLTRDLLAAVRDLGKPHILGGVFPTYAPEVAINFPEVDAICVGEGEPVIVPLVERLVQGRDISDLSGMWVKDKDGNIIRGKLQAAVEMDDLPRFDASVFDDTRFYRAMAGKVYRMFPVETHRGCPLKCTFCNSPLQDETYKAETGARYFRKKSIPRVMEDVEYFVKEMKAEYLFFWADNFLAYSKAEIDEFCEAYAEFRTPFFAQSYPTTLNEYKLQKLVSVGLDRLGMGVEHGNEQFRAEVINRKYSNQKAIDNVQMLKKYGVQYGCNNIVGFPLETPELHMDTVRLNRALGAHTSSCSIFTPFFGTPLRKLSIMHGFLKDPNVLAPPNLDDSILEMPQFTREQIHGKARTFNLYLKFPEERWKDIERAEALTPEGDRIWGELKEEYAEKYQETA